MVSSRRALVSITLAVFAVVSLIGGGVALSQGGPKTGPAPSDVTPIPPDDVQACMDCHAGDMEGQHAIDLQAFKKSQHKDLTCQSCHTAFTGAPHTKQMLAEKATCADCHIEEASRFQNCSHSYKDLVAGDHPNCLTCHSDTGNAHNIRPVSSWSRVDRVKLCSTCHSQKERMARYKVDTDAVQSYDDSFHGKALLKFGYNKAAICTDCHGDHIVLSPTDPRAVTNRANAAQLCAKPECHPGSKLNFAMSGANHLRLKMKEDPVLAGIDIFFRVLVFGVLAFMFVGIALDIRIKVFGPTPPKSGRVIGAGIALSFFMAILAILLLAVNQLSLAAKFGMAGIILLALCIVIFNIWSLFKGKREKPQKEYPRLSLVQRLQHGLLMISFTTLIATGLPLRYYQADALQVFQQIFGGMQGARFAHRVAAIGMIAVFLWHTIDLLVKWAKSGFSFKGWTMFPRKQDIVDFIRTTEYYLGLTKEEPKFGKFSFKQKLDYLAEYWGVPLMTVTGFILWFPIYWGNRLPDLAVSGSLVAHGWEATLAFLAIITWHMYNENFNPASFPLSHVWYKGTMSADEMEREHGQEKEMLDKQTRGPSDGLSSQPAS